MNFYNRVKFTTSTTGTGTITVGIASTGFRTPAQAGVPNGTVVRYVIEEGTAWETGYGTYTSSGTTLSRNVMQSSNGDELLNLTGSAIVRLTALAEDLIRTTDLIFIIGDGSAVVPTGIVGDLQIDLSCIIESVTLLANQSGSIVIDIWKDSYENYPPTDADSITASSPPTLSSAAKSQDVTLTGWTKTINAGDILRFNVDSASIVNRVTVVLKVRV